MDYLNPIIEPRNRYFFLNIVFFVKKSDNILVEYERFQFAYGNRFKFS